jgi:hypothetical protein
VILYAQSHSPANKLRQKGPAVPARNAAIRTAPPTTPDEWTPDAVRKALTEEPDAPPVPLPALTNDRGELIDYDESYQARKNGRDPKDTILNRRLDRVSQSVLDEVKLQEITDLRDMVRGLPALLKDFRTLRDMMEPALRRVERLNELLAHYDEHIVLREERYLSWIAEMQKNHDLEPSSRRREAEELLAVAEEENKSLREEGARLNARWEALRGLIHDA